MMSWKAPALTAGLEISSTMPSKVDSRLLDLLKFILAMAVVIGIAGVTSKLSVMQLGSLWNTELGAVSLGDAAVTQFEPRAHPAPLVNEVVQPAGRAGATTPSKFCVSATATVPSVKL